jgi:hypothetical protein
MPSTIRRVDYFYTMVRDQPGEAYKLLRVLADLGINQMAFTAVPMGPQRTQLTLFPENSQKFQDAAKKAGITVDGPHRAFLVQGDDQLGALVGVHEKLFQAGVNVYASTGVTDGQGSYGYVVYVRSEDVNRAAAALGI